MATPRLALVLKILGDRFDPDGRIYVLRTSQDPELQSYFSTFGASGATDMDPDGRICVKIDDLLPDSKGLCLEELAHALQYLRDGNVPLGADDSERCRREIEAAECLLKHADRLRLSEAEREHCQTAVAAYGGSRAA